MSVISIPYPTPALTSRPGNLVNAIRHLGKSVFCNYPFSLPPIPAPCSNDPISDIGFLFAIY